MTGMVEAVPPSFPATPPKQSQLTMPPHRFPRHRARSTVPLSRAATQPGFTSSILNQINVKNSYYDFRGHRTVAHRRPGQAHHGGDAPIEEMRQKRCDRKLSCGSRPSSRRPPVCYICSGTGRRKIRQLSSDS